VPHGRQNGRSAGVVSSHARSQLERRYHVNGVIVDRLEAIPGHPGRHAYLLEVVAHATIGDSSGDIIVAIVMDGEVITIMRRDQYQCMSPRTFSVDTLTDLRK
jgi:hypothetical protein